MQIPVTTLTLQTSTKTGIPGREKTTVVNGGEVLGSLSPLSKEDYIKRFSVDSYVDNGAYVLQTQAVLKVGQTLTSEGTTYKVIGFRKGRMRNTANLMEVR